MLHTEVVSGKTLELLKKLEAENAMTRFNLAGGTSLALYLGHRRSVDLDLSLRNRLMRRNWRDFLWINMDSVPALWRGTP
ncbi:hypothetical protein I1300191J6_16420 [Parabacteroides distasonis]|jgi:predicted nucleotidyltransferase component of viral defense system